MPSNPAPPEYLEPRRAKYNLNEQAKREARVTLLEQLKKKAQAEHDYRTALSVAFTKHRGAGQGVGEAEIHAKADAARHALDRDIADAKLRRPRPGWRSWRLNVLRFAAWLNSRRGRRDG